MGTQLQPSQLNSPGKDIESYLSSIHSIPILTKEAVSYTHLTLPTILLV